jgi:Na+-transporting methylmalonyl-CoA/oxaloacetate decarboxylase gamma subunit
MGFSLSYQISLDNLFNHGFNAIQFSIMGMLIVFGGLSIITLYIMLLPKILGLPGYIKSKKAAAKELEKESGTADDSELLLAITIALHLDQTRGGQNQKITWPRHDTTDSAWCTAGRIRALAVRGHHSVRS